MSFWAAMHRHKHEEALARALASLEHHRKALGNAKVDAALFRELHPTCTQRRKQTQESLRVGTDQPAAVRE